MKRSYLGAAAITAILLVSLTSCEQLFTGNMFSAALHEELTAASLATKSSDEIRELTQSQAYMAQLAGNESLKAAALAALADDYGSPPAIDDPTVQTAAITAAAIMLRTTDAASVTAAAIGAVQTMAGGDLTEQTVTETLKGIMPPSVRMALDAGDTAPPKAFEDMVQAFADAAAAFSALGNNLVEDPGTSMFTYAVSIPDSEKLGIAINAAVAAFVTAVTPIDTNMTVAQALWTALTDPSLAADVIAFDMDSFDLSTGSLSNLLEAAGLDLSSAGGI
jgi:hypothetical protein